MRREHFRVSTAVLSVLICAAVVAPLRAASVQQSWLLPEEEIHTQGKIILREDTGLKKDRPYQEMRARERKKLAGLEDPVKRARTLSEMALSRMEEFRARAEKGRYHYVLLHDYERSALLAMRELTYAEYLGLNPGKVKQIKEKLRASLKDNAAYLDALSSRVHEDVQGWLANLAKFCRRTAENRL